MLLAKRRGEVIWPSHFLPTESIVAVFWRRRPGSSSFWVQKEGSKQTESFFLSYFPTLCSGCWALAACHRGETVDTCTRSGARGGETFSVATCCESCNAMYRVAQQNGETLSRPGPRRALAVINSLLMARHYTLRVTLLPRMTRRRSWLGSVPGGKISSVLTSPNLNTSGDCSPSCSSQCFPCPPRGEDPCNIPQVQLTWCFKWTSWQNMRLLTGILVIPCEF